jgi:hypothetical protein
MLLLTWICVPVAAALTYRPIRRMLNVEWVHSQRLAAAAIVIALLVTAALEYSNSSPEVLDRAALRHAR